MQGNVEVAMGEYRAPLRDMRFVLRELAGLEAIAALPGCEEAAPDTVEVILAEAAKFAEAVLAPLNPSGDREGARFEGGAVRMPQGFAEAYRRFAEGGWSALSGPPEYGGQGLPRVVAAAVGEMWKAANHAFSLCPLLSTGAVEALLLAGSDELKAVYLEKLVSGRWTGTMNLTEPQAGSDLAAVRTRAEPQADGSYRLYGQKSFITYGEHDLAENIVHLVLARTPTAPEGVKGISLFVVPKFLPLADGGLGARNDVECLALEHKLGIHASPTVTLAFGARTGAEGFLVGEEHRGLEYMFVMMNAARFGVGMEGVAVCERAYQRARDYARERIQGYAVGVRGGPRVPIVAHPDVRRMLLIMRAQAEASRALAYVVAAALDLGEHHPDPGLRAERQAFAELLIPVVKGWSTELGVEVASLGIQVHGGAGYIEDTGAAQYLRDARISPIYEGTTGIQANDLVWRKLVRDGGAAFARTLAEMRADAEALPAACADLRRRLEAGIAALETAGRAELAYAVESPRAAAAGTVPFLRLFGLVAGGWQMARAAGVAAQHLAAGSSDPFDADKLTSARVYAEHALVMAGGLSACVCEGAESVLGPSDERV